MSAPLISGNFNGGAATVQNTTARLAIAVAVTAISMFGADNSIGTWKHNVAKSKTTPAVANPIKSLTIMNEPIDGGVKMTVTGERQAGTPISSSATVKYDGKEYPVTGAPWDSISIRQINDNTFTFEAKNRPPSYSGKIL